MVYRNRVIITVLLFVCAGGLWAQPYDKEYYFTRAQQYLSQGNLSGALEVYNTIIGFDPADAKAFNGRGLVYERRLDLNAAMMDYEHALELNRPMRRPSTTVHHFCRSIKMKSRPA